MEVIDLEELEGCFRGFRVREVVSREHEDIMDRDDLSPKWLGAWVFSV